MEELEFLLYMKKISPRVFSPGGLTSVERKALFRHMVQRVEIEVNSFCNRKCTFCANSFLDRQSAKREMPLEIFDLLVRDLSSIDYQGVLRFARYSEPLADEKLPMYIKRARTQLPAACLDVISNGDYLTPDLLISLEESGLTKLWISLYKAIPNWTPEAARGSIEEFSQKLNLPVNFVREESTVVHSNSHFGKLAVTVMSSDLLTVGYDRASSLKDFSPKDFERTSPCLMPFNTLNIDHDGKILLCCNTRSDDLNHKDFILGEVRRDHDLFETFFNSRFGAWRKTLLSGKVKPHPCTTCTQKDPQNSLLYAKFARYLEENFSV